MLSHRLETRELTDVKVSMSTGLISRQAKAQDRGNVFDAAVQVS
jgi:hypothetical protein